MGFFGKLFEKKACDICSGEIGLLGNRKLEDGNLCKECAKKLSPWFSERRKSTVAAIRKQLEDREANRALVSAFHTTRAMGENTKVLLDEDAGKFMVTAARDLNEANPDVLGFADVTGCHLDIDERRTEIKREGADGEKVSYHPPRYEYNYDFYVQINVNNPYFDEMRFRLNPRSVEVFSEAPAHMATTGVGRFLNGMTQSIDPSFNVEYRHYQQMGNEIVEALTQVRQSVRESAAAASAPKAAVTCPYCGATTTPDASGCCEYCGGAVNG